MGNIINSSLLVDDDKAINFFNSYVIAKHKFFNKTEMVSSGNAALEYLKGSINDLSKKPQIIFLDLNMPAMNGWEFLIEYGKLDKKITSDIKVFILTTSENPNDLKKSKESDLVSGFLNKPLSLSVLDRILEEYFSLSQVE
ncbi:response regulator [Aquimarina agarilytica]|uniref:response regulator n=1 Tax=Aquimarina agarilytica TaxID=1087449 RepID=UPI0002880AD0|nr:response regulator [Aquimarina agarilytica]